MSTPSPHTESVAITQSRSSEIRTQLSDGNLKPALRRLHDFAADFGQRDHQNEVVLLDSRLSQMRRDIRKFGISDSTSVERNKITANVLSLIDEIVDHFDQTQLKLIPQASITEIHLDISHSAAQLPVTPPKTSAGSPSKQNQRQTPNIDVVEPTLVDSVPIFKCEDLAKSYSAFSLSEVTLELRSGDICGLVGINGSGKTTLLRLIAGELRHSQGSLAFPGLSADLNWHAIRNQIAYVQQAPPTWYGSLEDNLTFVAAEHGLTGAENRAEVDRILYRLSLEDYRHHTWNQISGGYKMRFELARALLSQPRLLVLDEPLSPLDVLTQQLFLEDLRHLTNAHHQPLAVILSSQNLHEVEGVADQLLFLNGGKAVFCGNADDLGDRFGDHLFELQVTGSTDDIERALEPLTDPTVEAFGQSFHISVPSSVTSTQVLKALLEAHIGIRHFRDISRSTRRLFDSQGEQL